MPRIARRENPYESPARQQRHFKTQRDKVLRYLEEAAYISSSHFAVMFVNARGQAECFSTKLLAKSMNRWFDEDVLAEAEELARTHAEDHQAAVKACPSAPKEELVWGEKCPGVRDAIMEDDDCHLSCNVPTTRTPWDSTALSHLVEMLDLHTMSVLVKCWFNVLHSEGRMDNCQIGIERHPVEMQLVRQYDRLLHEEPDRLVKADYAVLITSIIRCQLIPPNELELHTMDPKVAGDLNLNSLALVRKLFAPEQVMLPDAPSATTVNCGTGCSSKDGALSGGSEENAARADLWGSPTPRLKEPINSPLRRGIIIPPESSHAIQKMGQSSPAATKVSPRASPMRIASNSRQVAASPSAQRSGLIFPSPSWPGGPPSGRAQDDGYTVGDRTVQAVGSCIPLLSPLPKGMPAPKSSPERSTASSKRHLPGRAKPGKLKLDELPRFASTPQRSPEIATTPGTHMSVNHNDAHFLTPHSQASFTPFGHMSDGYFDFTPGSAWSDSPERSDRMVLPMSGGYFGEDIAPWERVAAPAEDMRLMYGSFPQVPLPFLMGQNFSAAPSRIGSISSHLSGSDASFISSENKHDEATNPTTVPYLLQPPVDIAPRGSEPRQPQTGVLNNQMAGSSDISTTVPWIMI